MIRILIVGFVTLIFSSSVFADLRSVSTKKGVEESDFIVIGTLQSVTNHYQSLETIKIWTGTGEGILHIDKVIAGNVSTDNGRKIKSGDELRLKWSEFSACLMGWHRRTENEKGIWLLKLDKRGAIETSHPAQFASIGKLSEIKKYIKRYSKKFTKTLIIQPELNQKINSSRQDDEKLKATASETSMSVKATEFIISKPF